MPRYGYINGTAIELYPGSDASQLVGAYRDGGGEAAPSLDLGFDGLDGGVGGGSPAVAPVFAGGIAAVMAWVVNQFGLRNIIKWLIAAFTLDTIMDIVREGEGGGLPDITPWEGVLPFVGGSTPGGLDKIEGRLVRSWKAGLTWFAEFEQPRRHGSAIQYYAWSPRKGAWLPFRYRRNIVIGAKELSIASALGHKRRIGKRRILQTIAGTYGGRRARPHHHRR